MRADAVERRPNSIANRDPFHIIPFERELSSSVPGLIAPPKLQVLVPMDWAAASAYRNWSDGTVSLLRNCNKMVPS